MKAPFAILASSIFVLLTGCTKKVDLSYTPIYPTQSPNNIQLVVNSFKDNRVDQQEIGSHRNLYGMPIIKIKTDDSVPNWMTDAFKAELTNAGYTILNQDQGSDYEIEGKIHQVYTTSYMIYHGRMHVEITLKQNDAIIFQKEYRTKEHGGINWFATNSGSTNTLELNLQAICRQFIEDFSTYRQSQQ